MAELYARHNGIAIYHGDVLDALALIESESVDLVATSPPYNCRKGYENATDEVPWPAYYAWMRRVIFECYRVLRPGGTVAINTPGVVRYQHDHQYRATWADFDSEYLTHRNGRKIQGRGRIERIGFNIYEMMYEADPHLREPIVWVKGAREGQEICATYQMGSDNNPYLRPAHEFIWLGSKGRWYHRGGTGRRGAQAMPFADYTKDVWYIPTETDREHPAVWPAEIPRRLIRLFCHAPDSVILDPFSGKGTTLRVAHELGYGGIGIDNSEAYCRLAADATRQGYLFRILG